MLLRCGALVCALAVQAVADGGELSRLTVGELSPGSRLEITTTDRVYQGEIVDPTTGETRMSASWDGVRFTEPRTVFLLGATQGRYAEAGGLMLVKMNQLQRGMRMELGVGSLHERNRHLTAPVRSIEVY